MNSKTSSSTMPLGRAIPPNIGESAPHQKQKQQRRREYCTNDRYLLLIGLAAVSYMFLIYQSLQLASTSDVNIDDAVRESRRERRRYPRYGNGTATSAIDASNAFANTYAYPNATTDAHQSAINAGLIPLRKGKHHDNSKQNPGMDPYIQLSKNIKRPKRKNPPLPKKKLLLPVKVLHVAPDELRLPKPIINVGFPKGGTSTIFSFFQCNGLKAQHWYCCGTQNHPRPKLMSKCMLKNLIAKAPIFEDCGDYDVYTEINGPRHFHQNQHRTLLDNGTLLSQIESRSTKLRLFFPQHHRLDAIHQQHPNATLIFNQRSVEAWIDSVQSWDKNLQFEILNEFYEQNSTRFLFENTTATNNSNGGDERLHPAKASSKNTTGNKKDILGLKKYKASPFTAQNSRKSLETVYNYHLEYVRDWVARHPSHALVEVDITHEDAGKTLAESFGLNKTCWGHFNKNDGKKTAARRREPGEKLRSSQEVYQRHPRQQRHPRRPMQEVAPKHPR